MSEIIDPVFCLDSLHRYEPKASLTTTMHSGQTEPHTTLVASMRDTCSAVSMGDGDWVRYYDVLSLMIALKNQDSDLRVAVKKAREE